MARVRETRIDRFLRLMNDRGASDLHLAAGHPPMVRVHGSLEPIRYRTLTAADFESLLREITPPHVWEEFERANDADFGYEAPGLARFRVNLFQQSRGPSAVFRIIPTRLLTIEQLGLPDSIHRFTQVERGLVLVTGPTGSGKSTTLSAIINEINEKKRYHIITIEDPIEFVHPNKQSLVTQREVGTNATSFASALRAALREDPDLVLVGELRDLETVQMALTAAESGLLVFGTLHTNSAHKAIDRTIGIFPSDEQDVVRAVVGDTLRAVLAQQLLESEDGGRVAAVEVLFGSPALGNIVREGKTHQISNLIHTGRTQGMVTMDHSLLGLVRSGRVAPKAAYEKAIDKAEFRKVVREELGVVVGIDDDDASGA
jgi:twitching motility protein PilT